MTGDAVAGTSLPGRRPDAERLSRQLAREALDRLAELARRALATRGAEVVLLSDPYAGEDANAFCKVAMTLGSPLVVEDAAVDERVSSLSAVARGEVLSYIGVPLRTSRGEAVGALCVHDPAPRHWHPEDVDLLEQLSLSVVAELELGALATEYQTALDRWGLAIDAAGIGSFDWDLRTGQLLWDDRLLAMFGYDRSDFGRHIDDFNARLHPDDVARVGSALQTAIDSIGTFASEYRVVVPGAPTRWVAARGLVVSDEDGAARRLLGAAYETTDVHDGQARTTRVLEAMSAAFYSLDLDWRFTYVNAEAEKLLGRSRQELLGGNIWELFPAAVDSEFEVQYHHAVDSGRTVTFEAYYPPPLDGWYELRAWPSPDGLSVYFLDITARRAANERAEAVALRAELLADVTTQLSATFDAEEAVARLAQLLVPVLADFCIVTLVDEDGRLRDVGWAHQDPDCKGLVDRYAELRLDALTSESFVARAMRSGSPVVVAEDAARRICDVLAPGEAQQLLRELAPASAAILPMQARGRTVGLLSVFRTAERDRYADVELATVRDVAARAALALDNASLFQQQRLLAEGLQRSLLTPPPEPDHMQVVVRYVPAAEAAQVGGDWYDAFLQPDGATVLVIGDVVGHDTAAAAAMGQVRGLLRGIAFTTGEGPADVLTRLDAALEGLLIATTATAVVARVEQSPDEKDRGITYLRWSNAGHPPPMVVGPDGIVQVLSGLEADLLLGIDPTSERIESRVLLDRGTTVLLYTDGLVERRGQNLDQGLDRLRSALTELSGLGLDDLCDELLRRLLPSASDDDVALVAVRLHRQDQPRPAEAGPEVVPPEVPTER